MAADPLAARSSSFLSSTESLSEAESALNANAIREEVEARSRSAKGNHKILVIGRGGSGKSSLLQSLYFAFHNTMRTPPDFRHTLRIQGPMSEGTKEFNLYKLWPHSEGPQARGNDNQIEFLDSRGFIDQRPVCDSRSAQHWQLKALLAGQFEAGAEIIVEPRPWLAFWRSSYQVPQESANTSEPDERDRPDCVILVDDYEDNDEWMDVNTGALHRLWDLTKFCKTVNIPFVVVITKIDIGERGTCKTVKKFLKRNLNLEEDQVFVIENYHETSQHTMQQVDESMKAEMLKLLNTVDTKCATAPDSHRDPISVGGCVVS